MRFGLGTKTLEQQQIEGVDQEVLDKVFSEKIVLSAQQLLSLLPNRAAISRRVSSGQMQKVGAGFYCSAKTPAKVAQWISLSTYPEVVISGLSALEIHGFLPLSESIVEADVPPGVKIRNSLARFRQDSRINSFEVIEVTSFGGLVRTYSRERSLAELYLQRLPVNLKSQVFSEYIRGEVKWDAIKATSDQLMISLYSDLSEYCAKKVAAERVDRPRTLDIEQRVVQACILLLSRGGSNAINFNTVSLESGISVSEIQNAFTSITQMQEAVYMALTKMLDTQFKCIREGFQNQQEVISFFKELLASAQVDVMGHKIQRWAMAEESEIGKKIATYLSGAVLKGISDLIRRENPDISLIVAETRAYTILTASDTYQNLRWYYSSILPLESSPPVLAESYQEYLLTEVIPRAFKF